VFSLEPVTFGTELVNPIEHSLQERFSRSRRNPRLLELSNVPALTVDLEPHSFDLPTDMIKLHDVLARLWPFLSAGELSRLIGLLVREGEAGSIT
jgi:hypothetical protein